MKFKIEKTDTIGLSFTKVKLGSVYGRKYPGYKFTIHLIWGLSLIFSTDGPIVTDNGFKL